MMRAMLLEFPDDPACDYLDRQYMLGESLLVAPIFSREGEVTYYVPAGRWTHFSTGQVVDGSIWLRETYDFLSLPLLARPNSIIAIGPRTDRPDYDYSEGVTLQMYELSDGAQASAIIPSLNGAVAATFNVKREGDTVTVERQGNAQNWRVLLVNVKASAAVEHGTVANTPQGLLVSPTSDADHLTIQLTGK